MESFLRLLLLLLLLPLLSLWLLKGRNTKAKQLNLPPSPPSLPVISNLHQLGTLPYRSTVELAKKYGPVMLLHLGFAPTVFVTSPEMAREVLKIQDAQMCNRVHLQGPRKVSYDFRDIAFTPYSEWGKEVRKICNLELLSPKAVQSYLFVREEEISRFMNSLADAASNPVDLSEKLFNLMDAMICRIAFGNTYKSRGFDSGSFAQAVHEAMTAMSNFAASDFFLYFGRIIDSITGHTATIDKAFCNLDSFFDMAIEDHLDPNRLKPECEDIIDVLLRLERDQFSRISITKEHIKGVLKDVFLGAIATSALTMTWTMTELARHPKLLNKVQDEIRSYIKSKGKVEESDVVNFPYFKAVVKESWRLHPPVPLLIARETMADCKLEGYDIPNKMRLHVNIFAVNRDPRYWKNPEEFVPERFMENPLDVKGHSFEYLPFGSGRRICPGMNMGIANVELTLANLLYSFDWQLPKGTTIADINMDELFSVTLNKKAPLILVPIPHNWQTPGG